MPKDEFATLSFSEPPRLGELAGPGSELSQAIAGARARGPSDAHLQALREAVWAGVAGTAVTGAAAAAAHLRASAAPGAAQIGGGLGAAKVVVGLTFAGLLSAGTVIGVKGMMRAPLAPKAEGPSRLQPTQRTLADDRMSDGDESPTGPESAAQIAPTPMPASPKEAAVARAPWMSGTARRKREFAALREGDVPLPSATDSDHGLGLLARARESLTANPALSLSLTQEFGRRFSPGALDQERDVIAVEALRALDRRQEAIDQARQLLKQYPNSPYATKLGRMFPDDPIAPVVVPVAPVVRSRRQQ